MDFEDSGYDIYDGEEYWDDDLETRHSFSTYGFWDLWEDCLVPTALDGVSASKVLIVCCLIVRLTYVFGQPPQLFCHLSLCVSGLISLYSFFEELSVYLIVHAFIGLITLLLVHKIRRCQRGLFSAIVCIAYVILCEVFIVEKTHWHKIRGSQMVLSMKLISLAVDIDSGKSNFPNVIEFFGYCFCVGTVIFGPWVSFTDYKSILNSSLGLSGIWFIVRSLCASIIFLSISSCWSHWLLSGGTWSCIWTDAYRDALSFRSSHYFISFLSQSTAGLVGLPFANVASPFHIELPRSLVEVVIYWNIPMHRWLKNYVFRTTKVYGTFVAILLTYSASSLLHGLNFQLAAVLLSLGFYTYIEFVLRQRLASIFDACVESRPCKKDCQHSYQSSHPYVLLTNFGFGLIAVFHLAYLGLMFDSSSNIEEEGYSMHHTLSKWSNLSFASHWVAIATYMFYFLAT